MLCEELDDVLICVLLCALICMPYMYAGVKDWMLCEEIDDVLTHQFAFLETDQYFAGRPLARAHTRARCLTHPYPPPLRTHTNTNIVSLE